MGIGYLIKHTFPVVTLLVSIVFVSCGGGQKPDVKPSEDVKAKQMLQGTWVNEYDGSALFTITGDTVYYNDSLSAPAYFSVVNDTVIIEHHTAVRYAIRKLNASNLVFENAEGDEVSLVKNDNEALANGEHRGTVSINQGRKVKCDTVMTYGDKHYHAYTQVNPTTYKVYQQSVNNDGLKVESVYYDNIVHIAVYLGQQKVYSGNVVKTDFVKYVPKEYLDQAVLTEILIDRVGQDGVTFVAVITIPDSYTNYRVNILISPDGKKTLSL